MWYGLVLLASLHADRAVVVPANPVTPTIHPIVVPFAVPIVGLAPSASDSITTRGSRTTPTDATHTPNAPTERAASWSSTFTYEEHGIFVRVALNGIDAGWFLLDTGANATVVDDAVVSTHHLVPAGYQVVEGTASTQRARVYRLGDVSVNGATALAVTGVAQDLTGFPAPEGASLAGILGSDVLSSFVVTIDFASHQVTFAVAADSSMRSRAGIHFITDHGAPRIPVTLDGHIDAQFRIDTGLHGAYADASYVAVTEDVWRQMSRRHSSMIDVREVSARGIGDDEGAPLPAMRANRLAIGDAIVPSPWIVAQRRRGYFAEDDAVSLLGNGVLEHFSPVTIDYLTGTLYLTVTH